MRCSVFVCTTCEQSFAHFYNIFDNMAHAMEVERVPLKCDVFRFPEPLTVRQIDIYRAFAADCEKRGPVYTNAFHYFRCHNAQQRPPCQKRHKGQ